MKPKDAWQHRQGSTSMKRFAGSLTRSSLAVRCTGVSAFHFPIVGILSVVATYHDYGLHCSHDRGMAAW